MTKLRKPIQRVTTNKLGGQFGPDSQRPLVVTVAPPDGADGADALGSLILRPHKTRQRVRLDLREIYLLALKNRARRRQLEKARAKKTRLAEQRARRG